jgi:hypothetical protein
MTSTTSSRTHEQVQQPADCWNDWNSPTLIHHHSASFNTPMRAMEGKAGNLCCRKKQIFLWDPHCITPFVVQLAYSRPADKNSINFTDRNRINREPARRSWCNRRRVTNLPSHLHLRRQPHTTTTTAFRLECRLWAAGITAAISPAWPRKNERAGKGVNLVLVQVSRHFFFPKRRE